MSLETFQLNMVPQWAGKRQELEKGKEAKKGLQIIILQYTVGAGD